MANEGRRLWPRLALVAVLLAGTALRLDVAWRAVVFRGDQNVVPLMALHISRGEDSPLYFYGQHYMGAFGAYLMAGAFVLTGPSDFAVGSTMVVFSLLWMAGLYLLFGRLINPWAGVVAAAVVAFSSPGLIWRSVEPWYGYVPVFAYGTFILYCGVRLNDDDRSTRTTWTCLLGMAALAGLSIWTNPLCLPYLIIGVALLAAYLVRSRLDRAQIGRLALAVVVLLVVLSPVIVTGLRHGRGALFGFRPLRVSHVPEVIEMTFTRYMPELVYANPDAPQGIQAILVTAYVLPFLALVAGLVAGAVMRDRRLVRAALIPVLFALAFLPFYLTNFLAAKYNPRYFLMFYLLIAGSFAFPLALRRTWIRIATLGLLALIALSNTVACLSAGRGESGARVARDRQTIRELVERAEALGLRHLMCDEPMSYTFTWAARDRVIFTDPWTERYYPYLASAVADDDIGVCTRRGEARAFERTLTALGITADRTDVGRWVLFHDLVLPTRQLRLISPVRVSLVPPGAAPTDAGGFVDNDDETTPGARYDAETELVIDLGEVAPVAGMRFVARYEWDYPVGYTISGSADGSEWVALQRMARRGTTASIHGNRLFRRGHYVAMECRFSPEPARYVKINGLRTPAEHREVWRFGEVYVYGDAGDVPRPNEQEIENIARVLREAHVEFAFCDPWLSARLAAFGPETPDVLPYYSARHDETHVSRVVPVRPGVAIVVEKAHAGQAEALLMDATLGELDVERRQTPNYTMFVIKNAPDGFGSFPGLKWNGFTLVRTARVARAAWYCEQGMRLERSSERGKAIQYYRRSYETYPALPANLNKLAATGDEQAHHLLGRLTPGVETPCVFGYGISLVGYSLIPSRLVPGEPATLCLIWQLEGEIPYEYLPVFVHFTDPGLKGAEAIRFQANHNATFPLAPDTTVPRCLVLNEHTFTVPADCPVGELTIELGALTWWERDKRLEVRTSLRQRDRAVTIGTVTIACEPK